MNSTLNIREDTVAVTQKLFDKLAFWFKKNLSKHLKRYLCFFSKTVFGFNPYSKALCNILDGEQAYNLLFNFVELARTNIQRVDPICESLCLPPPQLSFDEY